MKWIQDLSRWIEKVENFFLISITLILVFGAFLQVILRNFFNTGIEGAEIMLRHLVLWIGFIGASLATKEEKHINIDLFSRIVSPVHKKIARIITDMVAIFITLVLAKAGWEFVMSEKEFGTVLFRDVPSWPFQIIIPIGFFLISLRFFLNLLTYVVDQKGEMKS
jgi:TRAP-type C4-dicarboxylate transport system permease small subunit